MQELRVVKAGVPKAVLEVLAPVVERLGQEEALVEVIDRVDAGDLDQLQHVLPSAEPFPGGFGGLATLEETIAGLNLVVEKLQADTIRPPPLPQSGDRDPDPVPLQLLLRGLEPAAGDEGLCNLLRRQDALAKAPERCAVQRWDETAQFLQQLLVGETLGIVPKWAARRLDMPAEFPVALFTRDAVDGDPRHLHTRAVSVGGPHWRAGKFSARR